MFATLEVIKNGVESNKSSPAIVRYANKLLDLLKGIVSHLRTATTSKSISSRSLLMWKSFQSFVTTSVFEEDWKYFLLFLNIDVDTSSATIIAQHTQPVWHLVDNIVSTNTVLESSEDEPLTQEEVNAIRGFVVKSLKKTFSKNEVYLQVLNSMHEDDSEDTLSIPRNGLQELIGEGC